MQGGREVDEAEETQGSKDGLSGKKQEGMGVARREH